MAALGKKAATLEETAAETLRQAEEKAARIRDLISRTSPKDEQQ